MTASIRISWKEIHGAMQTYLGLTTVLVGTSGVKFFRTTSNMAGQKARPVSITETSFLFAFTPLGKLNSLMNKPNDASVGKPT